MDGLPDGAWSLGLPMAGVGSAWVCHMWLRSLECGSCTEGPGVSLQGIETDVNRTQCV